MTSISETLHQARLDREGPRAAAVALREPSCTLLSVTICMTSLELSN